MTKRKVHDSVARKPTAVLGPRGEPIEKVFTSDGIRFEQSSGRKRDILPIRPADPFAKLSKLMSRYALTHTQAKMYGTIINELAFYVKGSDESEFSFLEAGVGTGIIIQMALTNLPKLTGKPLNSFHFKGIDTSEKMLSVARRTLSSRDVVIEKDDITSMASIPEGSVDVLVCNATAHHLTDDQKPLFAKAVKRVLKPGGRILLGEWDVDNTQWSILGANGKPYGEAKRREAIHTKYGTMVKESVLQSGPDVALRLDDTMDEALDNVKEHPLSSDKWLKLFKDVGFNRVGEVAAISGRVKVLISAEK